MNIEKLKTKLLLGKPILFEKSLIYQPTLNSIDEIGEHNFNKYVTAYGMNLDVMNIPEQFVGQVKIYDLFFMPKILSIDGEEQLVHLIDGMIFFFKTTNIKINEDLSIIVDDKTIINRDNFEELQEIILKVCCANKMEKQKEKVFKNAKQKEIHDRLMRQREEYKKRHGEENNESLVFTSANELVHEDNNYTYENIGNLTLWQLMNSVQVERIKDDYKMNLLIAPNSMNPSKLNLDHWKGRIVKEVKL